ncbi:DUF6512 family protein [Agrococcus casei]|uniref:DUF6512 family protein n=1 Tax=Agrococcus casei TaxID=343512 RepID=UPI003F9067F2
MSRLHPGDLVPLGVIGSLLRFIFDWTGHNRVAAIFSAVNESYWEQIKIAIWSVVLLQIVLFVGGGYQYASFIPAATIALLFLADQHPRHRVSSLYSPTAQ